MDTNTAETIQFLIVCVFIGFLWYLMFKDKN